MSTEPVGPIDDLFPVLRRHPDAVRALAEALEAGEGVGAHAELTLDIPPGGKRPARVKADVRPGRVRVRENGTTTTDSADSRNNP